MREGNRPYLWVVVERDTAELACAGFHLLLSHVPFDVQFAPVVGGDAAVLTVDGVLAKMLVFVFEILGHPTLELKSESYCFHRVDGMKGEIPATTSLSK